MTRKAIYIYCCPGCGLGSQSQNLTSLGDDYSCEVCCDIPLVGNDNFLNEWYRKKKEKMKDVRK